MKIAIGHTNMDLDCLGSLILAKRLFRDHKIVKSRLIHPVARNLYNLYQNHFDFINPKDLAGQKIEEIKILDTSSWGRVKEYFSHISDSDPRIDIYDHHPAENCDILGATLHQSSFGSNTTHLATMIMNQGIELTTEEATIALTGIYADTGKFIHENVKAEDMRAAAFLIESGASLKLVKSFLATIKDDEQREILHAITKNLVTREIQGHSILLSYMELEENAQGLAAVVEKVLDLENPDAYFAIFYIKRSQTALLIARSQKERIDLHDILHVYGGGGHHLAGSAKVKAAEGVHFFDDFCLFLENTLIPAARAVDIMTAEVNSINENETLLEASIYLEKIEHTGLPVTDNEGMIAGFLSLRDIMKGRKADQMHAPVKAYMTRKIITASPTITIREIERIFYKYHIGHLPIVDDKKLLGIVTRWDYLQFRRSLVKLDGISDDIIKTAG
ncbi:MAG: CBS domain-containing protein [Spirochaetales bacterium]|nr:CBS domain-containing protein [Spirochaetales bacterium]